MRVTLVTPPSPFLLSDTSLPWLGPLWVAACLRDRGHQVDILDLAGNPDYAVTAASHVRRVGSDVYGVTATAPDYPMALQIRNAIRFANPSQRVILGGAHATTSPVQCLGWDAVVCGDGFVASERALTENGIIHASKRGEIVEDVDALPFPARDLIDLARYDFRVCGERATSYMTQFGCVMGCTFCCGRDVFVYRKMRARAPARVVEELDAVQGEYPMFTAAMFYDDEVNIPPARAIALCDALANRRPTVYRGFIKAELFTEDVARAMSRAGFREVLTGVESGSDRILKYVKKNTTFEINLRARQIAHRFGIRFKASTMIGLPTETLADVMETKRWLLEAKPDDFDVTIYQPMRGSPIYDRPDQEGAGLEFSHGNGIALPYKSVPGEYQARTRTPELSSSDLVFLREQIDREVRQELGLHSVARSGG